LDASIIDSLFAVNEFCEALASLRAFGVRRSTFGVQRSAFNVRRSAFGVRSAKTSLQEKISPMKGAIVADAPGFTPVQDRFFEIRKNGKADVFIARRANREQPRPSGLGRRPRENRPERAAERRALFPKIAFVESNSMALQKRTKLFLQVRFLDRVKGSSIGSHLNNQHLQA
jgi:hypothetical protein